MTSTVAEPVSAHRGHQVGDLLRRGSNGGRRRCRSRARRHTAAGPQRGSERREVRRHGGERPVQQDHRPPLGPAARLTPGRPTSGRPGAGPFGPAVVPSVAGECAVVPVEVGGSGERVLAGRLVLARVADVAVVERRRGARGAGGRDGDAGRRGSGRQSNRRAAQRRGLSKSGLWSTGVDTALWTSGLWTRDCGHRDCGHRRGTPELSRSQLGSTKSWSWRGPACPTPRTSTRRPPAADRRPRSWRTSPLHRNGPPASAPVFSPILGCPVVAAEIRWANACRLAMLRSVTELLSPP